jgi:hypothetical protein
VLFMVQALGALIDLEDGKRGPAENLPPPFPGELVISGPELRSIYLRGLIHLRLRDGAAAAADFQRILDHPTIAPTSPLNTLAILEQGRAFAMAGEQSKARKAYQDFLAAWKDADPDVPLLREAKVEYAKLTSAPPTA